MAVSNFQIFCAVTVVAVATFINLPAPRFSQRLQEWRNMGQYFNYRGNAIFYQGELMNKLLLAKSIDLHTSFEFLIQRDLETPFLLITVSKRCI